MWSGSLHIVRYLMEWSNTQFQNKSFSSEINFENKHSLFITTHFPSGNAKMKKLLLFHACKIYILATTDIPRITVINQNEKLVLIASLVTSEVHAKPRWAHIQGIFSAKHIAAPKRQNEPKFHKHTLTVWPKVSMDGLNLHHTARPVSDSG